jgi:putative two-component system response regulator
MQVQKTNKDRTADRRPTMHSNRILIVEDDPFLRKASESGLKRRGFTIMTACNGEEALRQVRINTPDLILLDLVMPTLSGIEVLEALKQNKQTCNIPVLILSNSSMDADIKKAANLGALGYLVKADLSLQELGDRVIEHLGGNYGGSETNHLTNRR